MFDSILNFINNVLIFVIFYVGMFLFNIVLFFFILPKAFVYFFPGAWECMQKFAETGAC